MSVWLVVLLAWLVAVPVAVVAAAAVAATVAARLRPRGDVVPFGPPVRELTPTATARDLIGSDR